MSERAILKFLDGRRIPCEIIAAPHMKNVRWIDENDDHYTGPKEVVIIRVKDVHGRIVTRTVLTKRLVKNQDGSFKQPETPTTLEEL